MELKDITENDLSLILEVPEDATQDDVAELLGEYRFSVDKNRDASLPPSMGKRAKLYAIQGPKDSCEDLRIEVERRGYQLWP